MTINELRKYEEIKTARPRNDMILVKDLRKWAKTQITEQILEDNVMDWIEHAFNLEDKV